MDATQGRELTIQERIEVFMAKKYIDSMRKKRFTKFLHHTVPMYEEYSVNYIDNAVNLPNIRIRE